MNKSDTFRHEDPSGNQGAGVWCLIADFRPRELKTEKKDKIRILIEFVPKRIHISLECLSVRLYLQNQ